MPIRLLDISCLNFHSRRAMPNLKSLLEDTEPLPKPNVKMRRVEETTDWTAEEVKAMRLNPVLTGIGKFARTEMSDQEWVCAAARSIEEDGAKQFLVNMLYLLRYSFDPSAEDQNQEQGIHSRS